MMASPAAFFATMPRTSVTRPPRPSVSERAEAADVIHGLGNLGLVEELHAAEMAEHS